MKIQTVLRNTNGETLVEVLLSSLIAGLAIFSLFTMVMTSQKIMEKSQASIEKMYETMNQLEERIGDSKNGTVLIDRMNEENITIPVTIYEGKDRLAVYHKP